MTEKLDKEKQNVEELSFKMRESLDQSKVTEELKYNKLQTTMEQKIVLLEEEHLAKMAQSEKELDNRVLLKENEFDEQLRTLRSDFDKEKMELELKYLNDIRQITTNNDKKYVYASIPEVFYQKILAALGGGGRKTVITQTTLQKWRLIGKLIASFTVRCSASTYISRD